MKTEIIKKLKEIPFTLIFQELEDRRESDLDSWKIIETKDPLKATLKGKDGRIFYEEQYNFKIENNIITNAKREGKNPFFITFTDDCNGYFTTEGFNFIKQELSKRNLFIDDARIYWDWEDCIFCGIDLLISGRWYEVNTEEEIHELSDNGRFFRNLE